LTALSWQLQQVIVNLDSFCDPAHNVFAENQREQSRLVFKKGLSG
jgi:hypothetical protein